MGEIEDSLGEEPHKHSCAIPLSLKSCVRSDLSLTLDDERAVDGKQISEGGNFATEDKHKDFM